MLRITFLFLVVLSLLTGCSTPKENDIKNTASEASKIIITYTYDKIPREEVQTYFDLTTSSYILSYYMPSFQGDYVGYSEDLEYLPYTVDSIVATDSTFTTVFSYDFDPEIKYTIEAELDGDGKVCNYTCE
jgi:hypothetical protein